MVTYKRQVIIVGLLELDKALMYEKEKRTGGGNIDILGGRGTD